MCYLFGARQSVCAGARLPDPERAEREGKRSSAAGPKRFSPVTRELDDAKPSFPNQFARLSG